MLKATVKTGGRWPSVFCCLVLYGSLWCSMVLYGALWLSMVFYGSLWCSMALYGAPLHHVTRIIQYYRY